MSRQANKTGASVSHDAAIRDRQAKALRSYLKRQVLPFSAHYRRIFSEAGLRAEDFKTLEDLGRIPFTTKADLSRNPDASKRSTEFLLIPDPQILARRPSTLVRALLHGRKQTKRAMEREYRPIFMTSTTGRSAQPVPFLYSHYDLERLRLAGERMMEITGTPSTHRILNMFPYAPHLAFWQVHYAVTAAGVFCLSSGGGKVMGTDGNIRLLQKINPDVLIGMPTFLYHVLYQALEDRAWRRKDPGGHAEKTARTRPPAGCGNRRCAVHLRFHRGADGLGGMPVSPRGSLPGLPPLSRHGDSGSC
jgi:phenylacetate-CoA ligase